jgi:sterol desaturase/sphingolipid hydroxylase (fatty acid hydroxylase superfamily)
MRLSKAGYYADFIVYPIIIVAVTTAAFRTRESIAQLTWLIACAGGVGAWTLAEYCIHRFIFHRVLVFERSHDKHHGAPSALIGAPLWSSLSAFAFGAFIPIWWQAGLNVASGATIGLTLGYLWYAAVHAAIHRWRLDHTSFLYQVKLRHMCHHRGNQKGNFGVTTGLWDHLFRTTIES